MRQPDLSACLCFNISKYNLTWQHYHLSICSNFGWLWQINNQKQIQITTDGLSASYPLNFDCENHFRRDFNKEACNGDFFPPITIHIAMMLNAQCTIHFNCILYQCSTAQFLSEWRWSPPGLYGFWCIHKISHRRRPTKIPPYNANIKRLFANLRNTLSPHFHTIWRRWYCRGVYSLQKNVFL